MRIEEIRAKLIAEQIAVAEGAMNNATGKTLYDYGYGVGTYMGIGRAFAVIEEMYRDEKSRDQDM